jgi:hypothetical protein
MSNDADSCEEVRAELIRLLDNGDCRIAETKARGPGFPILRKMGLMPTEGAMIEYIADLLRTNFELHPVLLHSAPSSDGMGYVMKNCDGQGLYIKVRIEREYWRTHQVVVMSFHVSEYYKG